MSTVKPFLRETSFHDRRSRMWLAVDDTISFLSLAYSGGVRSSGSRATRSSAQGRHGIPLAQTARRGPGCTRRRADSSRRQGPHPVSGCRAMSRASVSRCRSRGSPRRCPGYQARLGRSGRCCSLLIALFGFGVEGGIDVVRPDEQSHNVGPTGDHCVDPLQHIPGEVRVDAGIDEAKALGAQTLFEQVDVVSAGERPFVMLSPTRRQPPVRLRRRVHLPGGLRESVRLPRSRSRAS